MRLVTGPSSRFKTGVRQKLAETNGVRIEIPSELGKGSTFRLYLSILVSGHVPQFLLVNGMRFCSERKPR